MVLSIVSNLFCYLFCCLCRHPNSKMSSYLSLHSEITLLTNNESKSSAQSFCLTHNCIKTGHPWSSLHSFIQNSTLYILVLHLLSHVIVLLSLLVSTFQTDHSITSNIHVLWNCLTSHLLHAAHNSTSSSTTSGSCISDLSTSHFLKNWSPSSSAFLFLFLTCILTWPTLGQISLVLTLLSLLNSL
jgi:hypothetical protein